MLHGGLATRVEESGRQSPTPLSPVSELSSEDAEVLLAKLSKLLGRAAVFIARENDWYKANPNKTTRRPTYVKGVTMVSKTALPTIVVSGKIIA